MQSIQPSHSSRFGDAKTVALRDGPNRPFAAVAAVAVVAAVAANDVVRSAGQQMLS